MFDIVPRRQISLDSVKKVTKEQAKRYNLDEGITINLSYFMVFLGLRLFQGKSLLQLIS